MSDTPEKGEIETTLLTAKAPAKEKPNEKGISPDLYRKLSTQAANGQAREVLETLTNPRLDELQGVGETIPPEQREYLRHKEERRKLYNAFHQAEHEGNSRLADSLFQQYYAQYGRSPEEDSFFDRETPQTREELIDILFRGDGTRVPLPVLVDKKTSFYCCSLL